jgi:hypothetical protein
MGGSLEDWVERQVQEGSPRRSTRLQQLSARERRATMPGMFQDEEDEDEDME